MVGQSENTTHDSTCVPPQVLQFKPVIWEEGEIEELPTFDGDPDGFAQVINDNGQVAGASGNCAVATVHALLWQNGTPIDLGNLGGTMNNFPQDINNDGQVVGFSNLPGDKANHAFLWTEEEGMQDLRTLPGDVSSFALGINDEGQVVGTSVDASDNFRAFLWQDGVMIDLNSLIPASSPLHLLSALSINSRGKIVGLALQMKTGQFHAFLAIPSSGEDTSDSNTSAAPGKSSERPKVVLPENVRKLLEQRLGNRYHMPGIGAPRD